MGKVELLSPAGEYDTMVAAFNAGADAVYLGGNRFGARAYANNFSEEEVIRAIKYAHLHGKKIYMTINTLVKENELPYLYDYLYPYDKAGLDGVIVQDFGVFRFIRKNFPDIELHASTQMTLTGAYGAGFLKSMGATRIVPARELTLDEIKNIKATEDIEIESFIHGAMCYCYSGACLFSSMVGSRSGNRGRCAQPCRLPYTDNKGSKEHYPLSLKDMCTVYDIPDLIEAGIDSFKIEGRMKSPEYAAGVTAIYRKYIDKYYQNGRNGFAIDDKDLKTLKTLYLRSEIGNGYYYKHNGKDMITLDKPGYNGTDEAVLDRIKNTYLNGEKKIGISAYCYIKKGEPIILTLSTAEASFTAVGHSVEAALKRPTLYEDVNKQISKFGNTFFDLDELTIDMDEAAGDVFIPVKALNELRREAVSGLENEIISNNHLRPCLWTEESISAEGYSVNIEKDQSENTLEKTSYKPVSDQDINVLVTKKSQIKVIAEYIEKAAKTKVSRIYIDSNIVLSEDISLELSALKERSQIYVALPYITRQEPGTPDLDDIRSVCDFIKDNGLDGLLARNIEELAFLSSIHADFDVVCDYGLYAWNDLAVREFKDAAANNNLKISEMSVPLELTRHEIKDLVSNLDDTVMSTIVYGYIPMMITANCLNKTLKSCTDRKGDFCLGESSIVDRQNHVLPYSFNCRYFMNIIWNALPISLHKQLKEIIKDGSCKHLRVDLTVEDAEDCIKVLSFYDEALLRGVFDGEPVHEYTTGHYKRVTE